MAKPSTDEKDADRDEADEADRDESEPETGADDADDRTSEPGSEEESSAAEDEQEASDDESEEEEGSSRAEKALVAEGEEEPDEEQAAAQLGIQRYVLAAFFAAGIVGAYILGKLVHGIWAWAANKDWFHTTLPSLAAVTDEDKTTWGTALGAVIALIMVIRTYRKPSVRTWADEVASELAKVKWPTRKEVSSSTVVVIAASAVATIYLALLDRLWSFVTDLFYGTGS
ncbi:MAG: preprotein translocase subunit SecE [Polyangiaceae bacterium]